MHSITSDELKKKINNLNENELILDVRTIEEFNEDHIQSKKILHIPLDQIEDRYKELENKKVYTICRSGQRSGIAGLILREHGIEAINVIGGMLDWNN